MKKFSAMSISGLMLISLLTGCTSESPVMTLEDPSIVSAQSTKKITLSMDKKVTDEVKKSDGVILLDEKGVSFDKSGNITNSAKVKKQTVAIKDKKDEGKEKSASKVNIQFEKPTGKNDFDSQQYAMMARYALQSMNSAYSYAEGYRLGLNALNDMASRGVYVARVSWSAANATQSWENGYKVVSSALNHIASDRPNTAYEACNLVLNMVSTTNNYSDGYRAGRAALQVIGQTDNQTVRWIVDSAIRDADAAWGNEAAYNRIVNALQQLRSSF